jgi:hypothetical protein
MPEVFRFLLLNLHVTRSTGLSVQVLENGLTLLILILEKEYNYYKKRHNFLDNGIVRVFKS